MGGWDLTEIYATELAQNLNCPLLLALSLVDQSLPDSEQQIQQQGDLLNQISKKIRTMLN